MKKNECQCFVDIIYINVCLSVLYAFLNGWTDWDEIWYRDRLDLWEKNRLHLVSKNVK